MRGSVGSCPHHGLWLVVLTFGHLLQSLRDLPLEMLETVLMRTFLMLYSSVSEGDDDRRPYIPGKSSQAERQAFTLLASVSSSWYHALTGWPQSPTGHWLKHKLKKLIERECICISIRHQLTCTVNTFLSTTL